LLAGSKAMFSGYSELFWTTLRNYWKKKAIPYSRQLCYTWATCCVDSYFIQGW